MAQATKRVIFQERLGPETWGDRVHRAYRRFKFRYGVSYDAAAEVISEVDMVSPQTLTRIENFDEAPTSPRARYRAVLAVLAYGFDPEDFDLSLDDLPAALDARSVQMTLDPTRRYQPR